MPRGGRNLRSWGWMCTRRPGPPRTQRPAAPPWSGPTGTCAWTHPTPAAFRMRLTTLQAGPLGFQQVRLAGHRATATNDGTGLIRIGHLTHGRFTVRTDRDEIPGSSTFLFPSRPYAGQWEDPGLATLTVDEMVVAEYARALVGREDFSLAFTGYQPVSAAMGAYWGATAAHLARNALPNDQLMASPLARDQLLRSIATAVLHTFPNTFLDRSAQAPVEATTPASVRRAIAFIDTHLGEPIGLAEIAAAARLRPRGLQAGFRRHLDTTPLHYLRTLRLAAAHQDLLTADPATGITVAAVAARWGFTHPGRFATTYRQTYGEPPATTLHR
ncbi:AraC family transcriptional regulator [Kocuria sp. U4B]